MNNLNEPTTDPAGLWKQWQAPGRVGQQAPYGRLFWMIPVGWLLLGLITVVVGYSEVFSTKVVLVFQTVFVGGLGVGVAATVVGLMGSDSVMGLRRKRVKLLFAVYAVMGILGGMIFLYGVITLDGGQTRTYKTAVAMYNTQLGSYVVGTATEGGAPDDAHSVDAEGDVVQFHRNGETWNVAAIKTTAGFGQRDCWMGTWRNSEPDSIVVYPTTLSQQVCTGSNLIEAGYLPDAVLSGGYAGK